MKSKQQIKREQAIIDDISKELKNILASAGVPEGIFDRIVEVDEKSWQVVVRLNYHKDDDGISLAYNLPEDANLV